MESKTESKIVDIVDPNIVEPARIVEDPIIDGDSRIIEVPRIGDPCQQNQQTPIRETIIRLAMISTFVNTVISIAACCMIIKLII